MYKAHLNRSAIDDDVPARCWTVPILIVLGVDRSNKIQKLSGALVADRDTICRIIAFDHDPCIAIGRIRIYKT
jgi:hypothetical protein